MVTKATAESKGNQRILQLLDQFPEIPRTLVVKNDAIREGIRPTPTTRKIGKWALPDAHDYFEYDKEDTHTPEETAEGYTLTPIVLHFNDQVCLRPMFDSRSPYEIRYEERGRYALYRDGEHIEQVYFPTRPAWYSQKTSTGRPMSSVISLRDDHCMYIAALTYCEYFKDNTGCRYCNIVPSESTKRDLGMERTVGKRQQDVYETFLAACKESKPLHVNMTGGVLLDPSREADVYALLARTLRQAMKDAGHECPIHITCQAMEAEDQLKLKEAGASTIRFNLEVWDERLFEHICPGKAKYVGRERWLDRLLQGVEIWDEMGSTIVVGIEMAPPFGFSTENEAAESNIEGWEWLMTHGVAPMGTPWRCVPGTEFAGMSSPRTEYLLRTELARHKLALKYDKLPQGCNRCSGQTLNFDWPFVDFPRKS